MKQLNYQHLYYFYLVAKEGSIAKACKLLHLTPQTVSSQIATFESYLGMQLFNRHGKRLFLNDKGKLVYSYAEDIFNLGHELQQSLQPHQQQLMSFNVGITDAIPKVFSYELLHPLFELPEQIKLICREGQLDNLLADMAVNKLDMIITDNPLPPGNHFKAYSHKLIESGLSFYVAKNQASTIKGTFPECLNGQPLLIPGNQSAIKTSLLTWLEDQGIATQVVAEFDDSALTKLFGEAGLGIFCSPTIMDNHVHNHYQVINIGQTEAVSETFYMITTERKIKHPAVLALLNHINSP